MDAPAMGTFRGASGSARGRVLVVDDEPGIRDSLAAGLRDEGHDVRQAASGSEALAMLAKLPAWRPDVVLVDLLMAPGTGWQFAQEYRARWGHRAALVLMTAAGPAALRSAAELGVDEVLPKPLNLYALTDLVAFYVRQRRSQRRPIPARPARAS